MKTTSASQEIGKKKQEKNPVGSWPYPGCGIFDPTDPMSSHSHFFVAQLFSKFFVLIFKLPAEVNSRQPYRPFRRHSKRKEEGSWILEQHLEILHICAWVYICCWSLDILFSKQGAISSNDSEPQLRVQLVVHAIGIGRNSSFSFAGTRTLAIFLDFQTFSQKNHKSRQFVSDLCPDFHKKVV